MTEEQIANLKKGETLEITQPDGSVIIIEGNPCVRCGKNIMGEIVEVDEGAFHPQCFTCAECECSLLEEEDYCEDDGEVFCSDCYKEVAGPRCFYCKQVISESAIQFHNRKYHPHHFGCFMCKAALKGKPFKDVDGEPYCPECAKKKIDMEKAKDLCFKCKQPITGDFIIINGMKCHPEHFTCAICKCEFTGGNSLEFQGKRYCLPCYKKVSASICEKCKKPIDGRSVQACGFLYHPECLRCTECELPLTGNTFFEHDGKPYCNFHYYRLFGEVCENCQEVIKSGEGVDFNGRNYHKKCFNCAQCKKPLDVKRTKLYESNPICIHCYNKLPSDVRWQLEEEERELERIEEKRKKEEKKQKKEEAKAAKKKEKEIQKQLKKQKK